MGNWLHCIWQSSPMPQKKQKMKHVEEENTVLKHQLEALRDAYTYRGQCWNRANIKLTRLQKELIQTKTELNILKQQQQQHANTLNTLVTGEIIQTGLRTTIGFPSVQKLSDIYKTLITDKRLDLFVGCEHDRLELDDRMKRVAHVIFLCIQYAKRMYRYYEKSCAFLVNSPPSLHYMIDTPPHPHESLSSSCSNLNVSEIKHIDSTTVFQTTLGWLRMNKPNISHQKIIASHICNIIHFETTEMIDFTSEMLNFCWQALISSPSLVFLQQASYTDHALFNVSFNSDHLDVHINEHINEPLDVHINEKITITYPPLAIFNSVLLVKGEYLYRK